MREKSKYLNKGEKQENPKNIQTIYFKNMLKKIDNLKTNIYIYIKQNLALNKPQKLIWDKT